VQRTSSPSRLKLIRLTAETPIWQETSIFDRPEPADYAISDLYVHDVTEIGVVVSGVGVHRIFNQSIPCKKGDVYIVHANLPHGYFTVGEGSLTVRRLWFNPVDWFSGEIAEYGKPRFCFGAFSDGLITSCAMLNAETEQIINSLLDDVAYETENKRSEWREAVRAHLSMLLITLSRYVGRAIKNEAAQDKEWNVILAVIKMIDEELSNSELTLPSIAEALYVSPSHLSRVFKRIMGETFADYLRSVRYDRAISLLTETEFTVDEIVRNIGLRDLPSFYHGFNAQFGMTPREYRANYIRQKNKNEQKGDVLMTIIQEISENLQKGKAKVVKELVQKAIDEGASIELILNEGLLQGMTIIGEKFKNNEVYVPEVLVAARAMNAGTQLLKPLLLERGITANGKVCIGTVQGDLHDIGKNLVKMMLEGKGLEVVDLGTDVSPETFVQTAIDEGCQVICCSALLTTTMGVMEEVVKTAERMGVRDKVSIMVGGAPVNEDFCKKIGADAYTVDAASAADVAVELCKKHA